MIFYDQHSHTNYSPDSRSTIKEVIYHIVELNKMFKDKIAAIAFTDHLDMLPPIKPLKFMFDIGKQQAEIEELQSRENYITNSYFPKLYKGIEIGLQPHSIEASKEYIAGYKFDVVIASLHFIDNLDPYRGTYFEGKDFKQAFSHAFETMYNVVTQFEDFDILGHFDYVARYSPYEVKDIFYRDFPDELDALLKYLAQNGKALEVNTKTYALHLNKHIQVLDIKVLKRFKELGGECITLGSDSHSPERVGDKFDIYWELIKKAGFTHLTYFEERKPCIYTPE